MRNWNCEISRIVNSKHQKVFYETIDYFTLYFLISESFKSLIYLEIAMSQVHKRFIKLLTIDYYFGTTQRATKFFSLSRRFSVSTLLVWVSVCLHPINGKKAKSIEPKFFVGLRVSPAWAPPVLIVILRTKDHVCNFC